MMLNRLDFEATIRVVDGKKIVDLKLTKLVPIPVTYSVSMKAGDIDLGSVAGGKMIFSKTVEIEIDKDIPELAAIEGAVRSWGLIGIFLPTDEGTFEG